MDDTFRIFVSIAAAIFLEAMPFLALGALLSAIVEVFVSSERLAAWTPRSLLGRLAVGVGAGVVFPTCECGVVPVARRLLLKGVPPPTALAYLLAAPIVNPIVLISTLVAFRGDWRMVGARALVAVLVASCVGFLVRHQTVGDVLRGSGAPVDHAHDDVARRRWLDVLRHAAIDFLEMGKYLILGALAAAALKAFLPAAVFGAIEGTTPGAVAGMMLFAILLSVCSEADAFVAASFVTLPAAAHLAFITIGPMVDLKLIGLFAATFRRRVFWILLLVPVLLVFVASLLLQGLW